MTKAKNKSRDGSNLEITTLARWETEGGALGPAEGAGRQLSTREKEILQCLGAALLLKWNDLPTQIQREVFGHALVDIEPDKSIILKEQIARFLHTHKDDSKSPGWPAVRRLRQPES